MSILLAYLTLCVVWGTTYLALKIGLEGFDPFFMAGVRFLLAGLLLLPVLFRKNARLPQGRREWLAVAATAVFMLAGANGLVTYSEVYLASGLTALTVATNPAWAALIGGWLFSKDEHMGWLGIAGMEKEGPKKAALKLLEYIKEL
jgi:drug/metabolite transporter (DMT)-like permease